MAEDTQLVRIIVETNAGEAAAQLDTLAKSQERVAGSADGMATSADRATAASTDEAIALERLAAASARTAAIQDRSAAQVTATQETAAARQQAITEQSAARQQAIAEESAARQQAIADRAAAQVAATQEQSAARTAAIQEQSSLRLQAMQDSAQARVTARSAEHHKQLQKWGKWFTYGALGIGAASLKLGADFQTYMTQAVTGANEPLRNLKSDMSALEGQAGNLGVPLNTLAQGFYVVSSAGFHGAAGVNVLVAATKAAKIEGANASDVVNALTSAMNAYHISGKNATAVTNEFLAAVSRGKMRLGDLAPALATILPVAAAAHISLPEVLGMIASQTAQGVSPAEATLQLRQEVHSLTSPNSIQNAYWGQLGLNQQGVMNSVHTKGLFATQQMLIAATLRHMGKNGDVLLSAYNRSQSAQQDLATMISAAKGPARTAMEEYASGKLTRRQFYKVVGTGMSGAEEQQFMTLFQSSNGFNRLLRSGVPGSQPLIAMLTHVFGTTEAAQVALETGMGSQGAVTLADINAARRAGLNNKSVDGWKLLQGTLNQMLDQMRYGAEAALAKIGIKAIPILEHILRAIGDVAKWLGQNKGALVAVAAIPAILSAYFLKHKLVDPTYKGVRTFANDAHRLGSRAWNLLHGRGFKTSVEKWGTKAAKDLGGGAGRAMGADVFSAAVEQFSVAVEKFSLGSGLGSAGGDGAMLAGDATALEAGAAGSAEAEGGSLLAMAGPIGAIVAGVAVLGVGIYELYKHWAPFRHAVKDVAHWIGHAVTAVGHFLKRAFHVAAPFLKAAGAVLLITTGIGPLIVLVRELVKHWTGVKEVIGAIFRAITNITEVALSPFLWITKEIAKHWHDISAFLGPISHIVGGIIHAGDSVWNSIFGGGGSGGHHQHHHHQHHHVASTQPALAHAHHGTTNVTIHVHGAHDPKQTAREVVKHIKRHNAVNGHHGSH